VKLKDLVLWAILGAVIFVLKMAMAGLPNIEPVSLLVIVCAAAWGWKALPAVYVYVFLEFLVWGIDLWSICYLYVWLLLFAGAVLLRIMTSALGWAVYAGLFGLFFGALCTPVYVAVLGWSGALSWWLAGLIWDVAHALGNFFLTLFLFSPLVRILKKA
jgi:energy-coupling factor transport system substrate-specific component